MSQTTNRLSLPLIQSAQAQKHVTHNEALAVLDALVQPVAIDADRNTPPEAPSEGDLHIVAAGGSGDWSGEDGSLAVLSNGGWVFLRPGQGWTVRVLSLNSELVFDGAGWAVPSAENALILGVNATADAINRLTVAAEGTLLTHEGAGHRLTVNKAAPADTASLLFQTGFSGRAEMGTAGTDNFAVKVSSDGTVWKNAMVLDAATAVPSYPAMPCFSATSTGLWREVTTVNQDLVFDTVTLNQGGHYNPATSGFTAPVAGIYAFLINGFLGSATNGRVCFGVDGATQADQMQVLQGAVPLSFTAIFSLVKGQVVTCRTGNSNTMLRYYQAHTAFSGWKIA